MILVDLHLWSIHSNFFLLFIGPLVLSSLVKRNVLYSFYNSEHRIFKICYHFHTCINCMYPLITTYLWCFQHFQWILQEYVRHCSSPFTNKIRLKEKYIKNFELLMNTYKYNSTSLATHTVSPFIQLSFHDRFFFYENFAFLFIISTLFSSMRLQSAQQLKVKYLNFSLFSSILIFIFKIFNEIQLYLYVPFWRGKEKEKFSNNTYNPWI